MDFFFPLTKKAIQDSEMLKYVISLFTAKNYAC